MKIFIGADHNGINYKRDLAAMLARAGYEVIDEGDVSLDPADDFPQFAARVVNAMLATNDEQARGILICGSGQGMCMAANRFKGIRASLCWNQSEARAARNDDDSNVLCLSSRHTNLEEAEAIVSAWLNTPFAGAERFVRRIKQLDELG
ncbi:MAG TPA: RpiB/LacA/LacB family sugar-phosphate isomerase [Candidatus Saccharimonadales bacterium]|nr:RpiB/LacA/LacB family sugar-phosphate isomerase [Candidatus Saccharimonadales bacterium]